MASDLVVERHAQIDSSPEKVFAFIADCRNDPHWCPKVRSCEQELGDEPRLGARYRAVHQPTRIKPAAEIAVEIVAFEPPRSMSLRQEDDDGVFHVDYEVEAADAGTRFTQRSRVEWKLARPLQFLANRMVPRHLDEQMRNLKALLESSAAGAS